MTSYQSVRRPTTNLGSRRKPFGLGVFPQRTREKVAPYSTADLDAYRDLFACPADATTAEETEARYLAATFSVEERRVAREFNVSLPEARDLMEDFDAFLEDRAMAALGRDDIADDYEATELAEMRIGGAR